MRVEIEISCTQTVELDVDDEEVARYGLKAVAEEAGSAKFDPDAADWSYYVTEVVSA